MFYPNIYHHITIVSYVKYGNMGNIIWECMGNMVKYVTIYHIMVRPFLAADLRRSSMPLAPRVGPTWSRRPTKMDITWKSREFGLREMRYNIYIYIYSDWYEYYLILFAIQDIWVPKNLELQRRMPQAPENRAQFRSVLGSDLRALPVDGGRWRSHSSTITI